MRLKDADKLVEELKEQAEICERRSAYYDDLTNAFYKGRSDAYKEAAKHVSNEFTTVDAAPVVHGHWLERVNPRWPAYSHDECSKCGWSNSQDARCYEGRERRSLKYCPNCGARMDGGAEHEDD